MKRIALIATCLAIMLAMPAGADEATIPLSHANAATMQALLQGNLPDWQMRAHGGAVELPEGVERTEAVIQRNAIRVVGTEDGITQLRNMLKGLDTPRAQVEVATTWIELQDPGVLGYALAVDEPGHEIAPPQIAVFADMSDDEISALKDAGTIISEPRMILRNGFPGGMAFETKGEGELEALQSLGCVAQISPDDRIKLQIDLQHMDHRPQAEQKDISLQMMVRVADGETILVAAVGEDGAIRSPVYLLTARVVEQ